MKLFKSVLSVILLTIFFASCKTSSDVISDRSIQKRKYRSGFFMASQSARSAASDDKKTQALEQNVDRAAIAPTPLTLTRAKAVDQPEVSETDKRLAEAPSARERVIEQEENLELTAKKSKTPQTATPDRETSGEARFQWPPTASDSRAVATSTPLGTDGYAADEAELLLYIVLAILLPPLAILLLYGVGTEFIISILLTLLFWLPGIIYALIHVMRRYG